MYQAVPRQLLCDDSYYFCVGRDPSTLDLANAKYPIVTRFDDWEFPHQLWASAHAAPADGNDAQPISTWTRCQVALRSTEFPGAVSDPKMIIRARDRTCRITACSEATEVAHLVPSAHASWFDRNRMTRYCTSPIPAGGRSGIDDDKNGILLRRDLHWLMDASRFVFAPKCQDAGNPVLLTHVLQPGAAAELLHLYHNRELQSPVSTALPLLFARFALSIFKSATPFVSAGEQQECKVRVFDPTTSKYRVRTMTRVQMTAHRSQSRSVSPRKRGKLAGDDHDIRDGDRGSSSGGCGESEENWYATEISETESEGEEELERARPRKRMKWYTGGESDNDSDVETYGLVPGPDGRPVAMRI
ncbi:hypothetical protein F4860DRAFT_491441, partial [Xylaria cubensis]